jgi:putative ABC transport system permease protein
MSTRPDSERQTATAVKYSGKPFYVAGASSLILPSAMTKHGWTSIPTGWLVHADAPLTSKQIADARSAAARLGMTTEVRSSDSDVTAVRNTSTLVGLIVAIVIAAMTVGLIRSEAASDIRTLTATGASSFTRRALTATTSSALAGLGVLLGVGVAYIALVTSYHAQLYRLTPVPVAQLLALAVLLPAGAAVAGWLLGNQQPKSFARQLSD